MREFASFNALRIIVSAVAVLGCLGLTAIAPSVAAAGATKTTVLAGNTPWGAGNTPWGAGNTPWGAGNTPWGVGNTPWG